MSVARISKPAISRPTTRAARTACSAVSGCTLSVQSVVKSPVRRTTTTRPSSGIDCRLSPCLFNSMIAGSLKSTTPSGSVYASPRRGSRFTSATSSSMVEIPSPRTHSLCPLAAAMSLLPTTSNRWWSPLANCSTRMSVVSPA